MPNWCSNELTVSGPTHKVAEILATIGDGRNFLSTLVPTPPELLEYSAPVSDALMAERFRRLYGAADWYDWNTAAWGTKWDVNLEHLAHDVADGRADSYLECWFYSAWVPPLAALDTVAERYPELTFELFFNEVGQGFSGDAVWADGAPESLQEGPAVAWCDTCWERSPRADTLRDDEGVTTCRRCMTANRPAAGRVPIRFSAKNRAMLDQAHTRLIEATIGKKPDGKTLHLPTREVPSPGIWVAADDGHAPYDAGSSNDPDATFVACVDM